MGIFGWDYPPGCSGPPDDGDCVCEICGVEAGSCQCPECSVCHTQGDPKCIDVHGLVIPEEIDS
jgi:hypothetical protein